MDYSLNEGQKSMMQSVSKNITGNFDLDPAPLYSSNRGEIFHITNKQNKQTFALKVIWNLNNQQIYKNEKNIHSSLKNRYIVKLQNAFVDKINSYLVLQYCKNGNLRSLINKKLTIQQVKQYGLQIAKGIDYLHKKKRIVHHEIKPQNILLTQNNEVRICDFGASVVFEQGKSVKGCEVSLNYSPPEAIEMHNEKYDIWSLGCVLYEMAVGKVPFSFSKWKQMILTINETYISNFKYDSSLPHTLVHLLKKIFVLDFNERISIDEVIGHSFFTGQSLQLSERMEKSEQRQVVIKKKSSSKSSFKSVEPKQSKKSNKQNRQFVNRLNGVIKVNTPNYKQIIQKKFKRSRENQLHIEKSCQNQAVKKQQLKSSDPKKTNQPFLAYNVKSNSYEDRKLHFTPLNTCNMKIAPLKINNYQIRIDKDGFTRQSLQSNIPQQINISCDGKLIKMRKGKKEKVYQFDVLPAQYFKEYQECKKLLTEIQAEQVRVQYVNKNFEEDKAIQLKIMYDNSIYLKIENQWELKNIKSQDFLLNMAKIPERYFKKLKEVYLFLTK